MKNIELMEIGNQITPEQGIYGDGVIAHMSFPLPYLTGKAFQIKAAKETDK